MNLSKVTNLISPQKINQSLNKVPDQKIAEVILWGIPTAVVPFRQFLDKDRTNGDSKELQYRDIITYTAGPASYFAGEYGARKFLEKTAIKPLKNLCGKAKKAAAIATGMALFMGWATYGAVNLAKSLVKYKKNDKSNKPKNPFEVDSSKNMETVKETGTTFTIKTPDEQNPYYLYSFSKYSQSFGNKDPFKRFCMAGSASNRA